MNIEDHFSSAEVYLEMANEKVQRNDFVGAQASLAEANSHTLEAMDHVQKLVDLKSHIKNLVVGGL